MFRYTLSELLRLMVIHGFIQEREKRTFEIMFRVNQDLRSGFENEIYSLPDPMLICVKELEYSVCACNSCIKGQ